MKTKWFVTVIAVLGCNASVSGQGFIPGDIVTHHFNMGSLTPTGQSFLSESYLRLDGFTPLGGGMSVSYEIFEGLPTGAPVTAGTFGGAPYLTLPLGTWADREGSFRLTVTGGPVDFSGVAIHIAVPTTPNPFPYNVYEFTIPVPEPGSVALLFLGLVTAVLSRRLL